MASGSFGSRLKDSLFGVVKKATFTVYDSAENYKNKNGKKIPVWMNPSEITFSSYYGFREISSGDPKHPFYSIPDGELPRQTITMQLFFDMVDLYNDIKKFDKGVSGTLQSGLTAQILKLLGEDGPGFTAVMGERNHLNVLNEKLCGYKKLEEAASDGEKIVSFEWGEFYSNYKYDGKIKRFDVSFTYFSEEGAPLRAEVNLAIEGCYVEK